MKNKILKTKYTLDLIKKNPLVAKRLINLSKNPIVIGGCSRSGTTLLLSVLSCHPHIFVIDLETTALCGGQYKWEKDINVPIRMDIIFDYLSKNINYVTKNQLRWCEKTPNNILFIENIFDYFGESVKFIHIVRDGRDVITSIHPEDTSKYWTPIEEWVKSVGNGRRFEKHPQVLTIRYEDLIRNYEQTLKIICQFIEEEFSEKFLSYPNTASKKESTGWFFSAKFPDEKSIGRWKNDKFKEIIEEFMKNPEAVNLLRYYNYLD